MVVLKPEIEKIKNSEVVKGWLKDLNENSKFSYREALADFCLVNEITPEEMLDTIYREEEQRLPAWERSANKWFEKYDEHCKKHKRSKNTRNVRKAICNGFLGFYGLPQYKPRGTRRKIEGLKEPNNRNNLTKDEINTLLETARSFKLRAIILTQCSSGLAISDVVDLTVHDFFDGLTEVYIEDDEKRRICKLSLKRIKTGVKFTTFLNEEAVNAIERYLRLERVNVTQEQPLFSSYKNGETHMNQLAVQEAYRNLNDQLGWKNKEKGQYHKFTSHMLRKFFNTQMINAGMIEEIREHFMGHKLKDKVREAYFLADPDELMKTYLRYMEHVTIKENTSPVSLDELKQLKKENKDFQEQISDILQQITPEEDLIKENRKLSEALNGVMYDNELYKNQMGQMQQLLENMRLELEALKNQA